MKSHQKTINDQKTEQAEAREADEIIPAANLEGNSTTDQFPIEDEIELETDAEFVLLDDEISPDINLESFEFEDIDNEVLLSTSDDPEDNSWDPSQGNLLPNSLFRDQDTVTVDPDKKALIKYDPLQSYLQEIKHIPTLTRDEEHTYAVKYKQEGDKAAGLKLVMANLRLVVMIAREHQRNVQNILDLVQEGNIGLLEAVEKYDPFRGIRFPSYAVFWIRAYVLRYLINNIRLVKIGTTQAQRKLFFNLVKEKDKLEREGFKPEAKLLAERLGVKESEVLEMEQRMRLPDLSVDAPVKRSDTGDSLDLHSVLPSDQQDIEEQVIDADFTSSIREIIDEFREIAEEKEIAIIDQRLLAEEPKTLQEIADGFGISRERIRQIEARLKMRLKDFFTARLEADVLPEGNNE